MMFTLKSTLIFPTTEVFQLITSTPKVRERHNRIIESLNRNGIVRVSQLSKELDTSTVTIRHDLNILEQEGLLMRIQGGAVPPEPGAQFAAFSPQRKQVYQEEKTQIAVAAAALVNDGDTLFINSGSTAYYFSQQLKHRKNISIVTNSLHVAEEVGGTPSFRVILLGGNINTQFAFTSGDDTINQLNRYRAKYTFLSVDGICPDGRITTRHSDEAAVCRLMMERARSTVVIADRTKIGKEGFTYISDVQQMNTLVTDSKVSPHIISRLRDSGVRVIIASPRPDVFLSRHDKIN